MEVKRYVYAVTKRLPEKQREDVARELESDIEAMISNRAGGKKPTEKHTREVLIELGDPAIFAQQYGEGQRYLIGPALFETYITLLKTLFAIVLPIVGAIALIAGVVAMQPVGKLIVDTLGATIETGVHMFFWLTFIFVCLERTGGEGIKTGKGKEVRTWSPDDLPQLPAGKRIPRGEAINGIVWSLVAIIWLIWQIPSIHAALPFHNVPMFFADTLWPAGIIALLIIAVGTSAVEVTRLVKGVWNRTTVWLTTIVNVALILYTLALVAFVHPAINDVFIREVSQATQLSEQANVGAIIGTVLPVAVIVVGIWEITIAWYHLKRAK